MHEISELTASQSITEVFPEELYSARVSDEWINIAACDANVSWNLSEPDFVNICSAFTRSVYTFSLIETTKLSQNEAWNTLNRLLISHLVVGDFICPDAHGWNISTP